ncbi:MAG: type III pantothenate kinase [Desulfovibrionales bacterium]
MHDSGEDLILLIDVGNTNTKFGIAGWTGIHVSIVLPTERTATSDRLGLSVLDLCRWLQIDPRSLTTWLVSSVVPPLDPLWIKAGEKFSNCPVRFVTRDVPIPLENRYARPEEVGADRLITAFGARQIFQTQSLIIVDFGTATTFDCVQGNSYLGGLICPGMESSVRALGTQAAKLPQINLENPSTAMQIGRSTEQSLQSGLLFGFAAMAEGLCSRLKEGLSRDVAVIGTGGLAEKIAPICPCLDAIQPDLLLQGMLKSYTLHVQNQGDNP